MKPFYEQSGITIFHGDCREILPTLADDSVDVIVTDPPYGIRWQSGFRTLKFDHIVGDDSTEAAIAGLTLCVRLLKRGRHIYAFGRYASPPSMSTPTTELIWDKELFSGGNLSIPWASQHEPISFWVNNKDGKLQKRPDGGLTTRLRRGSIVRGKRLNSLAVANHPTEKPVDVLRQLIESSSCLGERILDPFMGVGSTLVAARLEARDAIGIEIEEKYCEIAAKRLQQEALPLEVA
jgi:DNA modification methylase